MINKNYLKVHKVLNTLQWGFFNKKETQLWIIRHIWGLNKTNTSVNETILAYNLGERWWTRTSYSFTVIFSELCDSSASASGGWYGLIKELH